MFAAVMQQPEETLEIQKGAAQRLITLQKSLEQLEAQSAKVDSIREKTVAGFKEICHGQLSTLFKDKMQEAVAPPDEVPKAIAEKYTYRRSSLYFDPPKHE